MMNRRHKNLLDISYVYKVRYDSQKSKSIASLERDSAGEKVEGEENKENKFICIISWCLYSPLYVTDEELSSSSFFKWYVYGIWYISKIIEYLILFTSYLDPMHDMCTTFGQYPFVLLLTSTPLVNPSTSSTDTAIMNN